MDKFESNSQFGGSTAKARSQLDHIWASVPENEWKLDVTKVYLLFTNILLLHLIKVFKLPNTLPCITKKPLTSTFIQNIIYVTTCVNTWCISHLITPK
jgi:hypothetical protein